MTGVSIAPATASGRPGSRALARVLLLAPRNLGVAVLDAYRAVVSPLYGDVCRYYPSCSKYSLIAVQQHGLLRGSWLTAKRLLRCHPWAPGGIDDVPAHRDGHAVLARGGFVLDFVGHEGCDHLHEGTVK